MNATSADTHTTVTTPSPGASTARPRVAFEQYVAPRYRVPFFAAMAEKVDLFVVAISKRRVDGVPRR
jgi:hypothetical protein